MTLGKKKYEYRIQMWNVQFILITKREILWHCRLETNVNIHIVMESRYLNQFSIQNEKRNNKKILFNSLKDIRMWRGRKWWKDTMSFPQVSAVKTGDKASDKLAAGEECCTMMKKRNIESLRCTRKCTFCGYNI